MKTLKHTIIVLAALTFLVTSCGKDFLRPPIPTVLEETQSLNTAQDIQNAVIGAYSALAGMTFLGRNGLALVDAMGDLAVANNFLFAFCDYSYNATRGDLGGFWTEPYRTIDRSARVIRGGKRVLSEGGLTARDQSSINLSIAQAYGLKAYSHWYLVNLFAVPYTFGPDSAAVVLVDENPITIETDVKKATVAETYALILKDIGFAKTYFAASDGAAYPANEKFFMNEGAIYALEARVHLYMENWSDAVTAAQTALSKSGATAVTNANYIAMWGLSNTTNTVEDIFTLNFTSATGANMAGTLWGTQNSGSVTSKLLDLYQPEDVRLNLYEEWASPPRPQNYRGVKFPNLTNFNLPVFRASEMYLIMAEAEAQRSGGSIANAQNFLFNVAKRNEAITAATQLPSDKTELLAFIADERGRELTQEGHRWFDLRRRGDIMNRKFGDAAMPWINVDVKRIVLPLHSSEINAGKLSQTNWMEHMPKQLATP